MQNNNILEYINKLNNCYELYNILNKENQCYIYNLTKEILKTEKVRIKVLVKALIKIKTMKKIKEERKKKNTLLL